MNYYILLASALLAHCLQAAVKPSNADFLKPEAAIKKMDIPEGFEVTPFVAEPDIGEAIAFCFDERGRLWTLENNNYQTRRSHSADQKNRIQIFEDLDGDGRFDKKTLFTDKLTFASGIAVGMGGVYVGMPPELIFIPDANGDDVPDAEPEVLLDGWGIRDRHETLNSFIWGPDGWLYGCHGVFTQSKVGKPGAADDKRQYIDGGIWRFHPQKKEFEVFAEGLSNPWGIDFNDYGHAFATCCVIPHLFHIVQGGIYHKQSRQNVNPHVYDNIKTCRDHTHKSAHGGARFYLADAFPKEYHDRLFMCNIHEHAVLTDIMVPSGSGYIGKHGDDFLPTNDQAWVGFAVEIGPEGAVYILDWHDQDICGNSVRFADSGRVYRIMPKGAKKQSPPNLKGMTDVELVDLQLHANDWYVRQARTLLQYRAATGKLDDSVHGRLHTMFGNAPTVGKRLRAMWALQVINGFDEASLEALLDDKSEHVRSWAIQFLCEDRNISAGARAKFATLGKSDKSPIVRLFLASALQRLPFDQRWPILEALAQHAEDIDDHNIQRMLWIALEPMVPNHGKRALDLAIGSTMPMLQEFVPRRLLATGKPAQARASKAKKTGGRKNFKLIAKVAPGFAVLKSGEGGVKHHSSFRNRFAVQTHPVDRNTPSIIQRKVTIPKKDPILRAVVSHHPHGDWLLQVRVNNTIISKQLVSSKTVTDEWLVHDVDLRAYAGKTVDIKMENVPTGWNWEFAYWHKVEVVSGKIQKKASSTQPAAATKAFVVPPKGDRKRAVFISGKPSHGPMMHEHRAGNLLAAKRLNKSGVIEAIVLPENGYPKTPEVLETADTIVIFCTGHKGHLLNHHLDEFDSYMKKGTGVVMIHWATEAMKGKAGEKFTEWMGGFCDLNWSVNPHWKPNFDEFPDHPICNGISPFSVDDEWYYHMRFPDDRTGLTPILAALPSVETLKRPDGARSGNPTVRASVAAGEKQTVAWAYERPTGGRGFGFTGGHNHVSWQDDNFRKVILNAIVWTANAAVPKSGVNSPRPDDNEIEANLDPKKKK